MIRAVFAKLAFSCGIVFGFAGISEIGGLPVTMAQQPTGKVQLKPGAPPANGQSGNARPQSNGAAAAVPRTPQAQSQAAPVFKAPTPELIAILEEWEAKSSRIQSIKGKHTRYVYNHVFETEKRAEGKFYVEMPDKGRIDIAGIEPKKGVTSNRISKMSGRPYRVEKDVSQKWICNGDEILMVNDEEKSYSVLPLTEEMRGVNMIDTELPFLFGMKADEAVKRYGFEMLPSSDKDVYAILVRPKLDKDSRNYQVAKITLDKKYLLPRTVAMKSPTGNEDTYYEFDIQDVNGRNPLLKLSDMFSDKNPYHPNLKASGYKLAIQSDSASEGRTGQIQQVNGQSPAQNGQADPRRQSPKVDENAGGASPRSQSAPRTGTGAAPGRSSTLK